MMWNLWMTTIVVDQLHDDIAIVEWENESLSVVETLWLPTTVEEGDVLVFELHKVPLSNCKLRPIMERPTASMWLRCDGIEPMYMPIKPSWRGRVAVYWDIHYAATE